MSFGKFGLFCFMFQCHGYNLKKNKPRELTHNLTWDINDETSLFLENVYN